MAPGEALARSLAAPDLRAIFVLSDGLSVNGTELLRGIHRSVPPSVVVTGGLAGDGSRFKQTWVLVGGKPTPGFVVAVGLYGDTVGVSHGSRGGWDVFGPERVVTRSVGNVLHELDGEPALALYKTYLGERAVGSPPPLSSSRWRCAPRPKAPTPSSEPSSPSTKRTRR